MDLILVRHGHAVDLGQAGVQEDKARYLTSEGRKKIQRVGRFLTKRLDRVALIYSSPLVRARESAEILRQEMGARRRVVETEYLAPAGWDRGKGILSQLKGQCCVVVGHNPDFEQLASFCLAGKGFDFIEMKKAGVCWISFDGKPRGGLGALRMLLTPSSLSR